ncbi:MAG: hypothetical protein WAW13_03705 [Minisyncoccia bacterium]
MFRALNELQKQISHDKITAAQLEWFLNLTMSERRALIAGEKFSLLMDLGIITVPEGYCHANQLEKFSEDKSVFNSYNAYISDLNFANPSRILKPGDRLHVQVFRHDCGWVSLKECLSFLDSKKAVYPGAQGASLVFTQKRMQLPQDGVGYASVDTEERLLFVPEKNCRGVPCISAHSGDIFDFLLCRHDKGLGVNVNIFCFTNVE